MDPQSFDSLSLKREILKALNIAGYEKMTPVQQESLPIGLKGSDLIVQAKTGSGKTAAFGITILSRIDPSLNRIQGLVLCPTRELAQQVANELRKIARFLPNLKILTLSGGSPIRPQIASLEHGAHCIIGTPGRVGDHIGRRTLDLRGVKTFVLDEADRMLDMGFSDDLDKVVGRLPKERQTLLFSATFPDNIRQLSENIQNKPHEIKVEDQVEVSLMEQKFIETDSKEKKSLLAKVIAYHKPDTTVVFCNTKQMCNELTDELKKQGFFAETIHGDLDQWERDKTLTLLANKSISILVATDVAARGIDIDNLNMVVNYELPRTTDVYVHRMGRTGRAGKKGLALSFFSGHEREKIDDYIKVIEIPKDQTEILHSSKIMAEESYKSLLPKMACIRINGGKKHKLRPGDILGALTAGQMLIGKDVGQIDLFDFHTYVGIDRKKINQVTTQLKVLKIKGKPFHFTRES